MKEDDNKKEFKKNKIISKEVLEEKRNDATVDVKSVSGYYDKIIEELKEKYKKQEK